MPESHSIKLTPINISFKLSINVFFFFYLNVNLLQLETSSSTIIFTFVSHIGTHRSDKSLYENRLAWQAQS